MTTRQASPWLTALALLALLTAAPCLVQAQPVDPLTLQATDDGDGAGPAPAPTSSNLRFELWGQTAELRRAQPGLAVQQQRAVLDFRREWTGTDQLRAWTLGWSSRLEQVRTEQDSETRHALREAYVSRQWASGHYLDAGRIQWRNGVASGFNPSDFLKRGAVLDLGTQNPQALRENRLGTVMLREQWLGPSGSLQLGWMPKLSSSSSPSADGGNAPHTHPRSPAWERTNASNAALLRWAPHTGDTWTAEGLVYARSGEPTRWATNLTRVVGDSWIVYGEWAAGRRAAVPPNLSSAASHWDQELATGATWTSPWSWVLTLERQQASTPGSSDGWFTRLAWDKAFGLSDVNLAGFTRINTNDHSRLWQVDARWHVNDRHSLALIWGGTHGGPASEYGRMPTRRQALVSWTVYLP